MYRKYSEFLPSYLDGENIKRHSMIIEKSDQELYNQIQLLSLWNSLERPILIERVQEEPGTAEITIHIHTKNPIKKITSNLQGFETREYNEEELITQETITKTVTDVIPPVMPQFTVTVETYDGTTYTKGYLENDTPQGDVYDHDEFLDIIGNLLGIPRRIYKDEVNGYDIGVYEGMYPKYFTKQMFSDHDAGYITEDDYYYAQRLQKFISEQGTKPLVQLMAELLYEWNDTTISSMKDRSTSFTEDTIPYKNTPTLQLTRGPEKYNNLDYTNMNEILSNYIPITRVILTSQPTLAYADVVSQNTSYVNNSYLDVETWYETEDPDAEETDEGPLLNAPLRVSCIQNGTTTLLGTYTTGDDGTLRVPINGLPIKTPLTLQVESIPEYEYYTNQEYAWTRDVNIPGEVDMNIDAWKWGRYNNPSAYVEPYTDQTLQALCVGRGALCYTPLIDTRVRNWTNYQIDITFGYTGGNQHLGLGVARQQDNGSVTFEANYANWLRPDEILGTDTADNKHTMTIKCIDNTAYYYLDDEDTGLSQTLKNNAMVSFGCYNSTLLTNSGGLYIYDIQVYKPATINDDCTTLTNWLVTDSGNVGEVRQNIGGYTAVRPPSTSYQRIYWKYPLKRGTKASLKFKVYITTNSVGMILGHLGMNGQDHTTNVKSWWAGLGSTNNWTDGPNNSQNRHGGSRMSYNTWHTVEFKLNGSTLQTFVDDTSIRDYNIPDNLSDNEYFNDYFFLAFNGNGINVRDIEYNSTEEISEDTLDDIRANHMSQFNN